MTNLPKWLQILAHIAINIGSVYIAAKYPQYAPLVAAVTGTTVGAAANSTYKTVPPPPPSKP